MEDTIKINLRITKKIFYNNENNYGVYISIPSQATDENTCENKYYTVIGTMPKLSVGKSYNLIVQETTHKKYGLQYKFVNIIVDRPKTKEDEQEFLKNIVTERQFNEIIKVYQRPVTEIMDETFDITKVKYIGDKILKVIKRKVKDNIHMLTIAAEISKYGLDFKQIKKIVDHFNSADLALQKIKENPYVLYHEVDGFGFLRTDNIAQQMGIVDDDPKRIEAAILYVLEQEENTGNTYGYVEDIKDKSETLLQIKIIDIDSFIESPFFYTDGLRLARKSVWQCEFDIAEELERLTRNNNRYCSDREIDDKISELEEKYMIKYDEKQKQIFYELNDNNVIVLTGYAGTGKSSILHGILDLLDDNNRNYTLMSPTARAAKRMEQATGRKAGTIHRTLGVFKDGFAHNEEYPLNGDTFIIDEASMVDIYLFRSVLRAIPNGAKLLCVGDTAQLESINAGNVLYDMIASGKISCVKLDKVYRQEDGSKLLDVITNIRLGNIFFDFKKEFLELGNDCKLWFGSKELTAPRIGLLYKNCLSKYDKKDIMVISPMKNGCSGVKELNKRLQEIANPYSDFKKEIKLLKCTFREGDIVMHTKNNYNAIALNKEYEETEETGVFNGDMGTIIKIDQGDSLSLYVDYYDRIIKYEIEDLEHLELAYCMTIDKSQGSQSKVVIIALDTSHYVRLKRSLAYTDSSRAEKILFLVVDPRAFQIAIENDKMSEKRTFLAEDIKTIFSA